MYAQYSYPEYQPAPYQAPTQPTQTQQQNVAQVGAYHPQHYYQHQQYSTGGQQSQAPPPLQHSYHPSYVPSNAASYAYQQNLQLPPPPLPSKYSQAQPQVQVQVQHYQVQSSHAPHASYQALYNTTPGNSIGQTQSTPPPLPNHPHQTPPLTPHTAAAYANFPPPFRSKTPTIENSAPPPLPANDPNVPSYPPPTPQQAAVHMRQQLGIPAPAHRFSGKYPAANSAAAAVAAANATVAHHTISSAALAPGSSATPPAVPSGKKAGHRSPQASLSSLHFAHGAGPSQAPVNGNAVAAVPGGSQGSGSVLSSWMLNKQKDALARVNNHL